MNVSLKAKRVEKLLIDKSKTKAWLADMMGIKACDLSQALRIEKQEAIIDRALRVLDK